MRFDPEFAFRPRECCGPLAAALPYIAMGFQALSMISSAQAQSVDNSAAINAANYNADIADQNAKITESQAAADISDLKKKQLLLTGTNTATASASGLGLNQDIFAGNAAQNELDILKLGYQGRLKATSYRQTAALDRANAQAIKAGAPARTAAGILSGVSSIAGSSQMSSILGTGK